jgi:UPF0716 protein FxsA
MSQIALIVILVAVMIEIPLSLGVAWLAGGWILLATHIASAALGLSVIGYTSRRYGAQFVESLNTDVVRDDHLARKIILLLAGFLLLIPALQSNLAGLIFLLPSIRELFVRRIRRSMETVAPESDSPTLLLFEESQKHWMKKAA